MNTVLSEKILFPQIVNKLLTIYGNWRFIITWIRPRYLSLLWSRSISADVIQSNLFKIHVNFTPPSKQRSSKLSPSFKFPYTIPLCTSNILHKFHTPMSFYSSWLVRPKNIGTILYKEQDYVLITSVCISVRISTDVGRRNVFESSYNYLHNLQFGA